MIQGTASTALPSSTQIAGQSSPLFVSTPPPVDDTLARSFTVPTPPHSPSDLGLAPHTHATRHDQYNPVQPGTAEQICALFSAQYGPTYPSDRFRDPNILQAQVRDGAITIFVASDDAKTRVLAHAGLTNIGEGCIEVGQILVNPASRQHGFGAKVTNDAVRFARSQRPDLLLAWTYTAHTGSQRIFDNAGFTPIGLTVQDWPDVFTTGNREGALVVADRECVRYCEPREVFCPARLRPVLDFVYRNLGCDRSFAGSVTGERTTPPSLSVMPSVDCDDLPKTGSVSVLIPPSSNLDSAMRTVEELQRGDALHLSVKMNISHPGAATLIEALQMRGFFFSMIQPGRDGDMLTLQKNTHGLAAAKTGIRLHSPAATELLSLIEKSAG